MATRIKLRRDTAANWTSANPILALGEPGLETDTRKVKYGDGSTTWNGLSYAYSGSGGTGTDYTLPIATGSVLGGVKIGARLTITDGVLSADVQAGGGTSTYTLTTATAASLGGIKLGSGLSAIADGTVSATSQVANFAITTNTISNASLDLVTFQTARTLRINNLEGVTEFGASSGKITINGSNGTIIMPNNGEIVGSSGAQFTLTNVASILFGDGTRISTAVLNATTSTLTAGTYTVALSTTGTVGLAGDIVFPAVNQPVTYSVECTAVGSGQCTVAPGVYPLPQIGWFYNGLEIVGVTNISGSFVFNFSISPLFTTGTYDLTTGAPGVNKKIVFSDGTTQSTAYDPENLFITATIDLSQIDQDILPAADGVYNLGSVANSWRELHVSTNTIYIAGVAVGIGGSPTTLTINGSPITGTAPSTDITWTAPDDTTWEVVEYDGNFSGTYTQDLTLQTYAVTPAGAGSSSTIFINRLDYSNIDSIAPKIDYVTFGAVDYNITATVDDVYADGVIIYLQTPIAEPFTLTTATAITLTYTEPGTNPIKWFDFTQTANTGTNLLGGEIKYQATVEKNDGSGDFGGAIGTIKFNVASGDFDQTYLPMGPATGTNYTVYTSTATGGFSYQTEVGLGQNDRLKIQWKSTLFYNGTWGAN
jgi:hypothetical protein